ncbi:hypothetical protein [Nonomuraea insulae]|uniref:Tn3 transposase DDE domain-containing protein n=1 Tax=Nonomuraea insulae TaxID=1616787 RepID=A0ABW1DBF6_9ACTN
MVRWDRLETLLTDPGRLFREVYGWGTPGFDAAALVINLANVLKFTAVDSRIRPLPRQAEERLTGRPVPEAAAEPALQLFVSLLKGLDDALDVGVTLYPMRPTRPGVPTGASDCRPTRTAPRRRGSRWPSVRRSSSSRR